jgi:hypothetical protein
VSVVCPHLPEQFLFSIAADLVSSDQLSRSRVAGLFRYLHRFQQALGFVTDYLWPGVSVCVSRPDCSKTTLDHLDVGLVSAPYFSHSFRRSSFTAQLIAMS